MLRATPAESGTRRRFRFWNRAAVVMLCAQALVLLAGPIIDGRLEASSASATAHVEAPGGTKCAPVHSQADCVICRTLTDRGLPVAPSSVLGPLASKASGVPGWRSEAILERHPGTGESRAPPRGERHASVA